jgi:hypothetical protein
MGLNWGVYAAKTGPIIGPIIGMEVVHRVLRGGRVHQPAQEA